MKCDADMFFDKWDLLKKRNTVDYFVKMAFSIDPE